MKSYDQLQKENQRLRFTIAAVVAVSVAVIAYIGMNNIYTTEAARSYENKLEEAEAKAQVLSDELHDIKSSGTCLERIAMFEAQR